MEIKYIVNMLETASESMDKAEATIDVGSVSINRFVWDAGEPVDVDIDDNVEVMEIDRMPVDTWVYLDKDVYIQVIDELKSIQETKQIDREAIQQRLNEATKMIGEAYRLLEGDQL